MPITLYQSANSKIEYFENGNVAFKNARIMFRNFSGKPGKFNAEGKRNFCVAIPDERAANKLSEDGWNVRILAPRDPDDRALHYIPVSVSYGYRPPHIEMRSRNSVTNLDESTVGTLDIADIEKIDLVINPYDWEIDNKDGHKEGRKAYLKSMRVDLAMDELDALYDDDAPWDE